MSYCPLENIQWVLKWLLNRKVASVSSSRSSFTGNNFNVCMDTVSGPFPVLALITKATPKSLNWMRDLERLKISMMFSKCPSPSSYNYNYPVSVVIRSGLFVALQWLAIFSNSSLEFCKVLIYNNYVFIPCINILTAAYTDVM